MQLKLVRDAGVRLTVAGIDGANFGEPRIGRAIGEQFDGGMNRHGIERVVFERDGLVGFRGGCVAFVVGEREVGHQFVRLRPDFGSSSIALASVLGGLAVEAVGGNDGEADVGLSVCGILRECFMEKIVGVGVVEALVQQACPSAPCRTGLAAEGCVARRNCSLA